MIASDVDAAAARLDGVIRQTPLQRCDRLSAEFGAEVWLKREDLQPVRSYKIRGAYNLIAQLSAAERAAGVVCASAGNHGQGVAMACAQLGIAGRIYVPTTTPRQKRDRMTQLGGSFVDLVVVGDSYDEASAAAKAAALESGATLVPAFDDPRTIAGQGTIAREIVDQLEALQVSSSIDVRSSGKDESDSTRTDAGTAQSGGAPTATADPNADPVWSAERGNHPTPHESTDQPAPDATPFDTLLVPVGGGGLLAGCLAWLSERYPSVKVVGVEPAGAACMTLALDAGRPRDVQRLDTFVDGAAVRRAGDHTFAIARRHAPRMVTVPEGRICSEMLALYQTEGIIAEPAGALATASLGLYQPTPGERIVAVVSGGNNDVSRYSEIVERSLVYQGRKHYFLVNFPQEPGALRRFLDDVLGPDDDITLFEYVKRSNRDLGPALVGIELGDPSTYSGLLDRMDSSGMNVEVVSPDSPFYRFLV